MKIIQALFATVAYGCSSGPCSCPSGWTKATSPDGYICYQQQKDKASYEGAKEICQSMDTAFPLVDSDEDLAFYVGLKQKYYSSY